MFYLESKFFQYLIALLLDTPLIHPHVRNQFQEPRHNLGMYSHARGKILVMAGKSHGVLWRQHEQSAPLTRTAYQFSSLPIKAIPEIALTYWCNPASGAGKSRRVLLQDF
jgi:hypothetical protein